MDLANLPWQAWWYLARQLPHLDAAASLRHAADCPQCLRTIQDIRAAGRPAPAPAAWPAAVAPAKAATLAGIVVVTLAAVRSLFVPRPGRHAARPAVAGHDDTVTAAAVPDWHDADTQTRPAIQVVTA